ncbi:MAG: 2-amino-4-hydroxy-6-hydroxymethyldihydropteridine diphosphokinase [Candidatus Omnitrophota bacterium]
MKDVFIGVGSNIEDRRTYIHQAIEYLRKTAGIEVEKISSVIETKPQGGPPQPDYLNAVIKIKTGLEAKALLGILQGIETLLGRKRAVQNGPRTIDLDILLYGDEIIRQVGLEVPHPRMFEREFVMRSLSEIAPEITGRVNNLKSEAERLRK